jgi:hypothetical protein
MDDRKSFLCRGEFEGGAAWRLGGKAVAEPVSGNSHFVDDLPHAKSRHDPAVAAAHVVPFFAGFVEGWYASQFQVSSGVLPVPFSPGTQKPFQIAFQPLSYGIRNAVLRIRIAEQELGTIDFRTPTLSGFAYESFADWALRIFGAAASDPAIGGSNADPDGDGLSNFAEYSLKRNLQVFERAPLLPPVPGKYWNKASLNFTLPPTVRAIGVRTILQHSSNLKTWSKVLEIVTSSNGNSLVLSSAPYVYTLGLSDAGGYVYVTTDSPLMHSRPGFWRLKFE